MHVGDTSPPIEPLAKITSLSRFPAQNLKPKTAENSGIKGHQVWQHCGHIDVKAEPQLVTK